MIKLNIQKTLTAASGKMNLHVKTTIEKYSLVTLYGKSGAGKTSCLRIIAGLLTPDSGSIEVDGKLWTHIDNNINLPPQKRNIGFVFQDYALFPNMTVAENLRFALNKNQDKKIIHELIEIFELGDLQFKKPETLSGGQKQRVALARSLVQKPSILMLDEPLSALDYEIRHKLQHYILQVHKEYKLTTILISHDISEILRMSDKVIELNQGKVVKQGTPDTVFNYKEFSGNIQLTGIVIAIQKQDFLYILTLQIGKDIVKVVANENEGENLFIGDTVILASQAFNPVIHKIG